jgi:hypothetical protein
VDEAVAVRVRRQDLLYRPGKTFHIVMSEAALRSGAAGPPEVMTAQLDRLVAATALGGSVRLGILPFGVEWPVFLDHGFWLLDSELVIVETIAAELRLTRPDEIQTYTKIFDFLAGIASYGAAARAIITRALIDQSDQSPEGRTGS